MPVPTRQSRTWLAREMRKMDYTSGTTTTVSIGRERKTGSIGKARKTGSTGRARKTGSTGRERMTGCIGRVRMTDYIVDRTLRGCVPRLLSRVPVFLWWKERSVISFLSHMYTSARLQIDFLFPDDSMQASSNESNVSTRLWYYSHPPHHTSPNIEQLATIFLE